MRRGDKLLKLIQHRYPGYHPIMSLADIALDESNSASLRYLCHKSIIRYIEPEVKAVEAEVEERPNNYVRVRYFDDEEDRGKLSSGQGDIIGFIQGGICSDVGSNEVIIEVGGRGEAGRLTGWAAEVEGLVSGDVSYGGDG